MWMSLKAAQWTKETKHGARNAAQRERCLLPHLRDPTPVCCLLVSTCVLEHVPPPIKINPCSENYLKEGLEGYVELCFCNKKRKQNMQISNIEESSTRKWEPLDRNGTGRDVQGQVGWWKCSVEDRRWLYRLPPFLFSTFHVLTYSS